MELLCNQPLELWLKDFGLNFPNLLFKDQSSMFIFSSTVSLKNLPISFINFKLNHHQREDSKIFINFIPYFTTALYTLQYVYLILPNSGVCTSFYIKKS